MQRAESDDDLQHATTANSDDSTQPRFAIRATTVKGDLFSTGEDVTKIFAEA